MVKPRKKQNLHLAAALLILLSLISSSSSARPLNDFIQLAEASSITLPSERAMPAEKEGHISVVRGRGAAKSYGPLILNMLPKGKVPPSGPSKGTNNLNN